MWTNFGTIVLSVRFPYNSYNVAGLWNLCFQYVTNNVFRIVNQVIDIWLFCILHNVFLFRSCSVEWLWTVKNHQLYRWQAIYLWDNTIYGYFTCVVCVIVYVYMYNILQLWIYFSMNGIHCSSKPCTYISLSAPEILSGQSYNLAVDWWSLGIVMYLLSIGKVCVVSINCIYLVHAHPSI